MPIDTDKSIRFMTNNLLETGYNSFTVTSEHADHPLENLLDHQRTKTFKFTGRFLIDATNNKIYLDASTYTIPSADYATIDALLTAINTQTAGVATFSVNTLTNTVGVDFDAPGTLKFSEQTNAAWETLGFTGTVDVAMNGSDQEQADEARVHWPYEEFTIDLGYQGSVGFIALISDLAEELKIPEDAEIRLMGNTVNSFVAPPLDVTIPWYTKGAFRFLDDQADEAWRYYKLRITCPQGPFIPEIGYFYLGEYEKFTDKNIGTGFEMDYADPSDLGTADSGAQYGNKRTPTRQYSSMTVGLARPEHADFLKRMYALKQKVDPFFVALDPTGYLSENADDHIAFVRFTESPRYRHILRSMFELSFALKEAL